MCAGRGLTPALLKLLQLPRHEAPSQSGSNHLSIWLRKWLLKELLTGFMIQGGGGGDRAASPGQAGRALNPSQMGSTHIYVCVCVPPCDHTMSIAVLLTSGELPTPSLFILWSNLPPLREA